MSRLADTQARNYKLFCGGLAIASFGISLYWACLLVAVVLAVAGLASFYHGRALAEHELTPRRALRQVAQDIKTAKEQLT